MRLLTLLLVPLAFLALLASGEEKGEGRRISYDGHRLLRVEVGDGRKAELVRAMEARGLGQWRDIRGGSADLVLAPGEEGEAMLLTLERAGLEYQVVAEDLGRLHRLERLAIERRREESRDGGDDRQVDFDIFNFHRHDEINQYLFDLAGDGLGGLFQIFDTSAKYCCCCCCCSSSSSYYYYYSYYYYWY